mgnify:FL=1
MKERTMKIPADRILPEFPEEHLKLSKRPRPKKTIVKNHTKGRFQYEKLPAVHFDLQNSTHSDYDAVLVWIQERQEWIALYHLCWYESSYGLEDVERGPYALSPYCINMLIFAYGIPMTVKDEHNLRKRSPSQLEKLSVRQ